MKKKNLLSLLFVFALLFSLSMPASAIDSNNVIQLDPVNEYDYIDMLQNSSPQELEEIGLSEFEAMEIVSNFENALLNRASLSDSTLAAYGYNDSEIALFHRLAAGESLSSVEPQSLGSTCTGSITRHSCYLKSAEFSYTFTWNRCPIATNSDAAALRWIAYDSSDSEIGVSQKSSSLTVEYHFTGNAGSDGSPAFAHYGTPTYEAQSDFNTINMQFPVAQTHLVSGTGMILDCYAKTGTVRVSVKVPNGVTGNIHHIFVGGLYGHSVLGVVSPSISVSKGSIGISFTGGVTVDHIADRKATIYYSSETVEYWN